MKLFFQGVGVHSFINLKLYTVLYAYEYQLKSYIQIFEEKNVFCFICCIYTKSSIFKIFQCITKSNNCKSIIIYHH